MELIPLSEFLDGYEKGLINEIIVVGNKIYGRTVIQLAPTQNFKVVWSNLP